MGGYPRMSGLKPEPISRSAATADLYGMTNKGQATADPYGMTNKKDKQRLGWEDGSRFRANAHSCGRLHEWGTRPRRFKAGPFWQLLKPWVPWVQRWFYCLSLASFRASSAASLASFLTSAAASLA